ncbi:MAG TPA: SPFH domain-containing protein [Pirellulaceae bacterium]|nr:SPFH domain-containing protein [Pirellulaceae bacterium]HMO93972.1 SPFH domain-containing protein [Pirellulaceae bacterium]HMP70830.1 SPFH domain-containing protein [Pirellulaceae bacterium]
MIKERHYRPFSGWVLLVTTLIILLGSIGLFIHTVTNSDPPQLVPLISSILIFSVGVVMLIGFQAIAPNEARVFLLFGDYKGSTTDSGFFWVNPFFSKKKISMRVRNFETGSKTTPETKDATGKVIQQKSRSSGRPSKVNDRDGNPIEISAVVVWKVINTAEAMFQVDDYEDFVAVQSEAALRNLASRHPYDSDDHTTSLRGCSIEISEQLRLDIQDRLQTAGVEVIEARISHLAYAPEIAAAMLQRQQAQAVVAARTKIVEGAVGMVQMALEHLKRDNIVDLDDERKVAMVSNLLVVLCSDRHTQPVVNTGTLHN